MLYKMSEHGAALQTYNQELVKCLEDLKVKRMELQKIINQEEAEKNGLEKQIKMLVDKLSLVNKNYQEHVKIKENYDRTIKDTESGFKKILESSQILLNVAQHEANRLDNGTYKNKRDVNGHIEYNLSSNS